MNIFIEKKAVNSIILNVWIIDFWLKIEKFIFEFYKPHIIKYHNLMIIKKTYPEIVIEIIIKLKDFIYQYNLGISKF